MSEGKTMQERCEVIARVHNTKVGRGEPGVALPHFARRHVLPVEVFNYDKQGELAMVFFWYELARDE